jgi:hypothetical protein
MDQQIRMAIRDTVNRRTRKPFAWGGLAGYQQLETINQALAELTSVCPAHPYFQQLSQQVQRVLDKNRTLANNLKEAHQWLQQIADCLCYPPRSGAETPISSHQIAKERDTLLERFKPAPKYQRPQSALQSQLQRTWNLYGKDLLHTYDIPGLPPDNLQIDSLFGRVRRHQRRISGRKSTRELREFGHYQVLFCADNQADLLNHLRTVPLEEYHKQRQQLETAETSRRFIYGLHRDAEMTLQRFVKTYVDRTKQSKTRSMSYLDSKGIS